MVNVLYSSDIKNIKEVMEIKAIRENEKITFIASLKMDLDIDFNDYKIGSYDISLGYGKIITSNGIKEYKSLKALYNATYNIYKPVWGLLHSDLLKHKNDYKNEMK